MSNDTDNILNELRICGDLLAKEGKFAEAIEYYKKYIEINPHSVIMYNRIGHLYEKVDESDYLEEQEKYFRKALKLDPNYSLTLRNLAFVYFKMEKFQEAFKYFDRLLNKDKLADDYVAYACQKIKTGDFKEGWKYYEYRFQKTYGCTDYPDFEAKRWDGQSIKDKVLLVQCEQGFGDSIQFVRYLSRVKPLVKKIIFRVQDELFDLFKMNFKDIEIVKNSQSVKELFFDYHIPLLSLLYVLKIEMGDFPFSSGYIKADKKKVNHYKKNFFNNNCFKIGITWKGMVLGNKRRNVPLRYFYPLARMENIKVYSFQKDFSPSEIEKIPKGIEIVNLGKTFNDFSDTAAAMENIDIFITSDNSVFNLAGAMGKKTFVLLNRFSEWRWFLDEDTTPWYDSVKIFKKQQENDNWNLLMDKIIFELKKTI